LLLIALFIIYFFCGRGGNRTCNPFNPLGSLSVGACKPPREAWLMLLSVELPGHVAAPLHLHQCTC
jgi:hypothetical protein